MPVINNNKEAFQLLPATADSNSGSELSETAFPVRRKRYRRRVRSNPSSRNAVGSNDCRCKASTVSLTMFSSILICWLITLSWLAVVLHGELNRLSTDVTKVVAGSQGVPDALQKCHSLSRDLQKNQSQIMDRLNRFALLLSNFSLEMGEVKNGLHSVQNQLKSSPDLINNPTIVQDLSTSVASFGSQIKDQGATISSLRDQYLKLDGLINNLMSNISGMTESMSLNKEKAALMEKNFAAEKENILATISQMSMNVTSVNNTLISKLQKAIEDRAKDYKLIQSILETDANVTARVTYLEGLCAKETKQSPRLPPPEKQDAKSNSETISQNSSFPPSQLLTLDLDPSGAEMTKILENPT